MEFCLRVDHTQSLTVAPLSMGFPRQEYWSGLSFPSPGDRTHISCIGRQILYHLSHHRSSLDKKVLLKFFMDNPISIPDFWDSWGDPWVTQHLLGTSKMLSCHTLSFLSRAYFSDNSSPNFCLLQSGQPENFPDHQILGPFYLIVLPSIYLLPVTFYYMYQEEIRSHQ